MKNKKKQIAAEGKKLVSAKVDGGVQSDETEEEESEHSDHETVSNDGRKEVPPHPPPPQVVSVGDSANGDRRYALSFFLTGTLNLTTEIK